MREAPTATRRPSPQVPSLQPMKWIGSDGPFPNASLCRRRSLYLLHYSRLVLRQLIMPLVGLLASVEVSREVRSDTNNPRLHSQEATSASSSFIPSFDRLNSS